MKIAWTEPLFAWDCLEDSPNLQTVKEFLDAIPDEEVLSALRTWRGNGRDDYPVEVLWGTMLLTIALRHPTIEACLGELGRNEGLRRLIGIKSEADVPKKWNISRFLKVLGMKRHKDLVRKAFDAMVRDLGAVVPDLGEHTAGDSSGLCARRSREKERSKEGLPVASGGRKEYTDEAGVVVRVVEWFGYKFHILIDTKHEVILSYGVTRSSAGDNEELPRLVGDAQRLLPEGRMRTLAYDKAADDEEVHRMLRDAGIRPLVKNRSLWKDELERMLPGHDGRSNIVYDEAGTIYCYDKTSDPPRRHRMAYIGYERGRGTIKYRCPARHERWRCPSDGHCNAGKKYGKTLRVPCEIDLRRFPPIPRATKQFERLYKGRTAAERGIGRIKVFWGADDGNVAGPERFHAFIDVVMLVHITFATLLASAPRDRGTLGQMRLTEIGKALRARRKQKTCDKG